MAEHADTGRPDQYEWDEGLFKITSKPKAVNDYPSTRILEEDIPKNRDAERKVSFVVEIFIRSGRRLPPDRRKARKNKVKAFLMFHFEDIPVEIIAQELDRDDKTVYRYIAEMETLLFESEKIYLELKDRYVNDKDWKSLQVLHYISIGKTLEGIILTSIRVPFTLECADEADKRPLSLKDVVAAREKIRRDARIIFNKIKRASITAPATPFCFCTTQKHLTMKISMISIPYAMISPPPL